jgi:transcriptional regulator with XRE-family HTH domain
VKTAEREEARRLRERDGLPIKDIARRLNVSQSSVSLWVRDIELTPHQQQALRMMNPAYNRQLSGRMISVNRRRAARLEAQMDGRRVALGGDPLHVAGSMLYWAEGGKKRNQVRFSNSDPDMVRLFVRFLRTYFAVSNENLRITCHLFADHLPRQREIEQFWLDALKLPRSSLCKSVVNVYSKYSTKKRRNKLPYGTCRVMVSRTAVAQSIYGAIQEYAQIERPEWLDMP